MGRIPFRLFSARSRRMDSVRMLSARFPKFPEILHRHSESIRQKGYVHSGVWKAYGKYCAFWKCTISSETVLKEYRKGSGYSLNVRRHKWQKIRKGYWKRSDSIRHVINKSRFPKFPEILHRHSESIRQKGYVHSGCSESIPITSKFSFRMHQELDACFPNVFRTCRMLLECFPNTSRIHTDVTFGWSMGIILNMHNTFLELPNAVPYTSVGSRTASMLLEHTECFPNIIRSLPEHPNSYSESNRNGIRPTVIGP